MAEWAYLEHPDTGGMTCVPDEPGVIAAHEARGWVRADPPESVPFVPAGAGVPPDEAEAEWVELVHPDLPAAVNRVPNNPVALQGAYDAGWQRPDPPGGQPEDQPATKPAKRKQASAEPADHDKEG